ncbi:MAG: hypothetical protein HQ518_05150 [Rhodopirellula sp.]|nr:hypothetical protein [Rhodopirellula sp.]
MSCRLGRLVLLIGFLITIFAVQQPVLSDDYVEGFDSEKPTWVATVPRGSGVRVREHRRNLYIRHSGQAAEQLQISSLSNGPMIQLEHELPRSAPIEDLSLSLEYRSNRPGAILAMRMVFPRQTNPATGQILTAWLRGDLYSKTSEWQTLKATAQQDEIRQRITRLRAEFSSVSLNLNDAYIDRAVLLVGLQTGTTELFIDDLRWTGYAAPQNSIVQVNAEQPAGQRRSDIQMRLDRLIVNGRPSVLRFAPHHDELPARLRELGLNAVWIKDYTDIAGVAKLGEAGIWSLATPPRGRISGEDLDGTSVPSLDDFGPKYDGILGWLLGTRIPPGARDEVTTQVRLIRAADRLTQRPIIGDIGGMERSYSRLLDGVGLTRHPLQTAFSLHDYRQFLTQKRRLLRPGTFVTTWVQTEPEPNGNSLPDPLPVIEPELIRQLAWTGLSAGARGIGYWKRTSFDDQFVGAKERDLIIAITNQEIALLEPWLASWTVHEHQRVAIPVESDREASPTDNLGIMNNARQQRELAKQQKAKAQIGTQPISDDSNVIEMAIMTSPNGQLLIPLWYQKDAQFVPGQMAAQSIDIVIPGVPDTATIWKVSTTGVSTVQRQPGSTGARVSLENFDQLATLVISTDPNWGNILRNQINQISDRNAQLWYELASEKLRRVQDVDAELQQMGHGIPDGPQLMARARSHLALAAQRLKVGSSTPQGVTLASFQTAYAATTSTPEFVRLQCQAAMQSLRILQRIHWEAAIAERSSAVASPYTLSFQTLPEHWRFVRRVGTTHFAGYENQLPSGDFENTDTAQMIKDGWTNEQDEIEGVRAAAELASLGSQSGFALRLLAVPNTNAEIPIALEGIPIALTTPPLPLKAGQIVHISGRIRIQARPAASIEGVTVTESLTGSKVRWKKTRGWETFELIREVKTDSSLRLRLTLHGLGEVLFDDLKIVASTPTSSH